MYIDLDAYKNRVSLSDKIHIPPEHYDVLKLRKKQKVLFILNQKEK